MIQSPLVLFFGIKRGKDAFVAYIQNLSQFALVMLGKLPRAALVAVDLIAKIAVRYKTKGPKPAWCFFRYYVNNLRVSFYNCHFNTRRVTCPCCGWQGYDFIPMDGGVFWAPRMVCPNCLAYDRHRAFHLYAHRHDDRLLKKGGVTLHFAPERYVTQLAQQNNAHHYLTTDLDASKLRKNNEDAFQADILKLPLADNSMATIVCFHVLEHINDDRSAAAELYRVLKPGGCAYIMVPLNLALRTSHYYGKPNPDIFDHYWAPGRDYQSHLSIFDRCRAVSPEEYLSKEDLFRYGTPPKEIVFVCEKDLPRE